jgi:hypothetical protein
MTKERELLRRALIDALRENGDPVSIDAAEFLEEMTYLSTPSDDAEEPTPVAWGCRNRHGQIAFATLHPDEYEHVTLEPLYAHPSKPTKPEARELYSFVEEYLEAWENGMAGDSYLFYLAQTALAKARGEA